MRFFGEEGIPPAVVEAMRRYGPGVGFANLTDGRRFICDGMGSRGSGPTWDDALLALESHRAERIAAVEREYARAQERRARFVDRCTLAGVGLVVVLAILWLVRALFLLTR